MKFRAVSTFNAAGRDLYGRRMLETYRAHWPGEVPITVYSEGWKGDLDLETASPWLAGFKARHRDRSRQGDFRLDAVRFAHKAAAICHAAREGDADVLIWLDGDIVTHAPVSVAALDTLAPNGEWIAWLDRAGLYPETGFFMLDRNHPRHEEAISEFEAMYVEDRLFYLPEWHDAFVLHHVVRRLGLAAKSLSGRGWHTSHPLANSEFLGGFLDHLKGGRKREGRSRPGDLKFERTEEYWK